MYIYNVWNDDNDVDHWTYSAVDALAIRSGLSISGLKCNITRYVETYGVVNTGSGYMRMTDLELVKDANLAMITSSR